ncbi:MAG TPA: hypothetical protein VHA57_08350 [Actinomycetota bacterium]|nr:hypothetical protein [Actinomycetota bacterium]
MRRPSLLRRPLRTVAEVVAVGLLAAQGVLFAGAVPAGAGVSVTVTPRAAMTAGPTINEYRPPGISATASSDDIGITTGPDGNLWFTDSGASLIGTITTSGSGLREFPTTSPDATPDDIVSAGGRLWFTEFSVSASQVGEVTTGGTMNEFGISLPGAAPSTIVVGPDGNLWFTDFLNGSIGTLSPNATPGTLATTHKIDVPTLNPTDITVGPDHNLWFTESGAGGGKIGVMTSAGTQIHDYPAVSGSGAGIAGIVTGPDGNIWYTEQNAGKIGKMNPSTGTFTEYPVGGNAAPSAIVSTGGNLWFVDQGNNAIGEITPGGAVTEFAVPTAHAFSPNVSPVGLTVGPDGNLWFTEQDTASAVAQLVLSTVGSGGGGGNNGGGGGGGCSGGGPLGGLLGLIQSLLRLLGLGGGC